MFSSHPRDMQHGKKDAGFALQTISILWQQQLETNVIGSEKTCHVDNYFKIILFMIIIEHDL